MQINDRTALDLFWRAFWAAEPVPASVAPAAAGALARLASPAAQEDAQTRLAAEQERLERARMAVADGHVPVWRDPAVQAELLARWRRRRGQQQGAQGGG